MDDPDGEDSDDPIQWNIPELKKPFVPTRERDTGHTIVVVMPVCTPVGEHQLVAGDRRQKKVDRQLSFS